MKLPKGTIVAVADGENLSLFRNTGDEANLKLTAADHGDIDSENQGSGSRQNSSGNPDNGQAEEDNFAAGIVDLLNKRVLNGKIDNLVIIAAPRALGGMRKHYHKTLSAKLLGEISKVLTGSSVADIESAVEAA